MHKNQCTFAVSLSSYVAIHLSIRVFLFVVALIYRAVKYSDIKLCGIFRTQISSCVVFSEFVIQCPRIQFDPVYSTWLPGGIGSGEGAHLLGRQSARECLSPHATVQLHSPPPAPEFSLDGSPRADDALSCSGFRGWGSTAPLLPTHPHRVKNCRQMAVRGLEVHGLARP